MTWQPIETAPHMVPVLVWGGSRDGVDDAPVEELMEAVAWFGTQDWDGDLCWRFADFDSGYYGSYNEPPTHWMPLPAPPTE